MANDLKININGTDYSIEGDDLATEATLRALLAATRKMTKNQGIDEEKRRRSDEFNRRRQQIEDERRKKINDQLSQGTSSFSNASKATGGLFGSLKDRLGGLMGRINPLGLLMSGLGFVVGGVISAFGTMMGIVTEMTGAMKELYASGSRFNLNMSEMARTAGLAGMGITEFVGFLNKNQAAIAQFGQGTLEGSIKTFSDLTKALFGTSKKGLVGLGMSMQEVGQVLADYATIHQYLTGQSITTRGLNESENEITQRIIRDTTRYVNTLDGMARATGKTRDELNALAQGMAKDVDINSTLRALNLPAGRRDELVKFTTLVSSLGGQTMLAGVKSILQLGTMTGETAAAFARVGPGLGAEVTRITMGLANGSLQQEQAQEMYTKALADNAEQISATLGLIPEESRSQAEKDLVAAAQQALERRALQQKQIKEIKEEIAEAKGIAKERAQIEVSDAEAAVKLNEKRSQEVAATEQMNQALAKAKAILPTILLKIFANETFRKVWDNVFGENGIISRVSTKILDLLKPGQTFTGFFAGLFDIMAKELKDAWRFIAEALKPVMKWIGDKVMYFMNTTFKEWLGNVLSVVPGVGDVGDVMVKEARALRNLTEATEKAREAAANKPLVEEDEKKYTDDPEIKRLKAQRDQAQRDSEELIRSRNEAARRVADAQKKLDAAQAEYDAKFVVDYDSPTGGLADPVAKAARDEAIKQLDVANQSALIVQKAVTDALPAYTRNIENIDAAMIARQQKLKKEADDAAAKNATTGQAATEAPVPAIPAPVTSGNPAADAAYRRLLEEDARNAAAQPVTPPPPVIEKPKEEEKPAAGTPTTGANNATPNTTALNNYGARNPMLDQYNQALLDGVNRTAAVLEQRLGRANTGRPVMAG